MRGWITGIGGGGRGSVRQIPLFLVALFSIAGAGVAAGQYVDFSETRMQRLQPGVRPSVRLAGMGQLGLVIPDENNQLTLLDFGHNLAGLAENRDGWSLESWGTSTRETDDYLDQSGASPIRVRDHVNQQYGGVDAVYHVPGKRALGLTTLFDRQENIAALGASSKIGGPNMSAFWNEVRQPISAAVRLATWGDDQNRISSDVFGVSNSSTGWLTTVAGAWSFPGWRLGGQLDVTRSTVTGISHDPGGFHTDQLNWRRPETRFRVNLLRPESHGFAFGLNLDGMRLNGNEERVISWSDRFSQNPSRVNYRVRVPTITETDRQWGAEGRASYRLPANLLLGGYGLLQKRTTKVVENPGATFPGSLPAQDVRLTGWRAGAGLGGVWIHERLRAGVEAYAEGRTRRSVMPRSIDEISARTVALHAGAELLLPSRMVLRAGALDGVYDEDLDAPLSLYKSRGVTIGLGYQPRGGLVCLDAAYRAVQQTPDYEGGTNRKTDVQDIEFSARFLF